MALSIENKNHHSYRLTGILWTGLWAPVIVTTAIDFTALVTSPECKSNVFTPNTFGERFKELFSVYR